MKWDISLWTRETCLPHRNCYDRYIPRKGLFCHITVLQPEKIILPTSQSWSHLSIIVSDRKDKTSQPNMTPVAELHVRHKCSVSWALSVLPYPWL